MQIQVEQKRKRKGISVSLTPDKHNSNNNNQRPASPPPQPVQHIQLKQSFVSIQQQPIYPKYVRVFASYRAPDTPPVRFTYSNVSKDHEIRQGMILDQQIHALKSQLQNKRQIVYNLQKQRNQLVTSNVRPGYTYPQPIQTVYRQPIQKIVKIQNTTSPIISQPIFYDYQPKQVASSVFKNDGTIKPVTQIQYKNIIAPFNQYKVYQKNIKQSEIQGMQEIQIQQNKQKVDMKVKNTNLIGNSALNSTIKKENKKQESPPKVTSKASKQNNKKIDDRIERLKWAEQKLLDIIKICDNGL